MSNPKCFDSCHCGEIEGREHCTSRHNYCYNCKLFYGYIERELNPANFPPKSFGREWERSLCDIL